MGFLYVNYRGENHRRHSYSAGNTYDNNPYFYYLQKVLGWKEKNTRARFEFGKALESAIQYHHEHQGEGAVAEFQRLWGVFKDNKELEFTKVEKDWATLLKTGEQMIRLYQIRQPKLPIPLGGQTVFQREFEKELFPNDPIYGEIEDVGKLDIVTYVEPDHPMLVKLDWKPEYGALRPLIVDIKTAGQDFPETYGIAAHDLQLRRYSYQSNIRDVALLWFAKKSHSLQKGSSVTLLIDKGPFKAGDEAVIAYIEKDDLMGEVLWLVHNDFLVDEMERAQGKKADGKTDQTKIAKERRYEWLCANATSVDPEDVTKQRLQFNAGFVSVESAEDAGNIAKRQVINIVNAHLSGVYENRSGIRYPHDDRSDPYFRAFILKDEVFQKQNFTQSDEDALDDLFDDEQPEAM